ncbi:hypothetical protein [uncultured Corynebacterium sp.]|uniref:hypothetical protein n=1 Tax=uncultured Corynebacterium sp. TaxID=159447 RepID=UPI0026376E1B|nr:hypothetical protein [uncultured Corynebacterium sp.]
MQLPSQLQAAMKRIPFTPHTVGALLASVIALVYLVTAIAVGGSSSKAPAVEPRGEKSVIQVVTVDGKTAGVCALGGLREERMHYTDKNSVYYWELKPGEERIDASCTNIAALSSGKTRLEGNAIVKNFDAPQVVTITVQ